MTAELLQILLGSSVVVALIESLKLGVGKWRPRTAVEDERSAKAFSEMQQVANAYKEVVEVHKKAAEQATEAMHDMTHELVQAKKDVENLRLEVATLEAGLVDASDMITRLMALVTK